jgi:hypothetical protein
MSNKDKLGLQPYALQAGHSGRVRPGPVPNPEVKPVVAAVLLICVSGWEAAVLALNNFFLCYFISNFQ